MEEKVELKHTLKEIVTQPANFAYFNRGKLFYEVSVDNVNYFFPVDITDTDDIGDATFENVYPKALTLMRYIRKAIESDEIRFEIRETGKY